jgi:hypothetical protein
MSSTHLVSAIAGIPTDPEKERPEKPVEALRPTEQCMCMEKSVVQLRAVGGAASESIFGLLEGKEKTPTL